MTKQEIIKKITDHEAVIIWEIDDSKYYGLIGYHSSDTWWLEYELEQMTNKFLLGLLKDINNWIEEIRERVKKY